MKASSLSWSPMTSEIIIPIITEKAAGRELMLSLNSISKNQKHRVFAHLGEHAGVKGSFLAGSVFLLPKRNDPRDTHWEEHQSFHREAGVQQCHGVGYSRESYCVFLCFIKVISKFPHLNHKK